MELKIQASLGLNSVCRLCQLRSQAGGWLWTVTTIPGHRLEVYCHDCYQVLYDRAKEHLPKLPLPQQILERGGVDPDSPIYAHSEKFSVEIPSYLVKDGKGLRFFWPEDPIDLGLLRQRARRKREKAKEILP
jgi:hypothetical protein